MLLKDFLKKYWWRYSIGVLFLIAVDLIQIIIPKKVGEIVDILKTPSPDLQLILTIVTGVVFLAIGLSLGRFLWRVTIIGVARLFEFKTINKMFFHIMDLDQDFYDRWRTGDLMTRFTSDTQTVMRMLGFGVIMLVDTLVVTLMTVLAMGEFVSWKLTLLSTIPIPFIAIVSVSFGRIIHKRFTKLQECTSELSNITEESVSGIQVVKVFSNQQTMKDIFNSRSKKFYDAQVSLTRIWGLMFPLINFLGAFSSLLVFFFGGKMVVNGEITLGNFVMTNSYVGMLIWPMMAFGWLMNILQSGRASIKRIKEVLNQQKSIVEKSDSVKEGFSGLYSFKNFSFSYPNTERRVLKDINITIEPGQMIALVGKVGSGKSTLAKLMAKLYPVDNSMLYLDSHDINDIDGKYIRENVSYVPQESFLFSMTIRENIAFSDKKIENRVGEYAAMASVDEDIKKLAQGYETVVGERGVTLSGGQKQRVTIARALAKDSRVIILDDCLSAVDTETEEAIIKSLRKETMGKTVVIVSHRLKAVKNADQIFVFDNGSIVESGTHNELLRKKGLYNSMYEKQLIEEKLKEV
jgi:ATP-binding cassette subfamily B protein